MIDRARLLLACECAQRLVRDRTASRTERHQAHDTIAYFFEALIRSGRGVTGSYLADEGDRVRTLDVLGHRFFVRLVPPDLADRFGNPPPTRRSEEVAWIPRTALTRDEQLKVIEEVTELLGGRA